MSRSQTYVSSLGPSMTPVTGSRRINIIANPSVVWVGCGLRMGVAVDASKYRIIGGVGMAIRASGPDLVIPAGEDREPAMCGSAAAPGGASVASRAREWVSGRRVVRVVGGRVFGLVAGVAVCRRAREDVADVAACAGRVDVHPGEREFGGGVIEGGRRPGSNVVADFAGLREPRGRVRWIRGCVEVGKVARDASCGQCGELAVSVARRAGQRKMRAGEREPGVVMVEDRIEPILGGVAGGGLSGGARGHVLL